MAKSLKKYKKPPRSARELVVEEQTPPAQRKAMKALGIPPKMAPVKKATRKPAPPPIMKQVTSEDESDGRVDSGNEGGVELELPSAAIPTRKRATKVAASIASTTDETVVEEEGPVIPPTTLAFMARWLPKWHAYCSRFPHAEDFGEVAPYCSAGVDLLLAFTHDVTASHISKKGLPFDTSPPTASPWEVRFNNVFYPADKIRNFIDINVRRFEKFRDGENMEGRLWVDMDARYRKAVEGLLEKMERLRSLGSWEKESRRVNEMVRYGAFGKVVEESMDEGKDLSKA